MKNDTTRDGPDPSLLGTAIGGEAGNAQRIADLCGNQHAYYPEVFRLREQVAELANKLAAAEAQLAKERQAGRDEVLKELSEQEPVGYTHKHYAQAFKDYGQTTLTENPVDDWNIALFIRPQPPKE